MKTRSIYIIYIISCLFFSITLVAQKESNIWYFGKNAGLDFNTSPPTALVDGKINTREGVASISDKNTGQLLFYTEGTTVWDATHAVMPNGSGLLGDYSSTQSSIAIPDPADTKKYYLVTTALDKGLRYSQVDMVLNGGKGDVISASKNTLLIPANSSSEKVIAVQHCNKRDYWVITHTLFNNSFYVYLVNAAGIQAPVVYNIGSNLAGPAAWTAVGYLKLSPSGNRLAHAIGPALSDAPSVVELLNFNNITGVISGPVVQLNSIGFPYGVEFSPNQNLLYVSEVEGKRLHQYDLTSSNINASKLTLFSSSTLKYGALQLGPDGKIYVSVENGYDVGYGYLSVINNPDVRGLGCNYIPDAIDLKGKQTLIGLPTFLANYLKDTSGFTVSGTCVNSSLNFKLTYSGNVDSLKWNFGDGSPVSLQLAPQHVYNTPGSFNAELIAYRACNLNDTIRKQVSIKASSNTVVTSAICAGSTYTLANGTIVSQPGDYPISYSSSLGCDSVVITRLSILPIPLINLGKDTSICSNTPLKLNAGNGFNSYVWQDRSGTQFFNASQSGTYWVEVQAANGCKKRDSVDIAIIPSPSFSLGQDSFICKNQNIIVGTTVPGAVSYLWNTGASGPQITINKAGIYWLEIQSVKNCRSADTIIISNSSVSDFTLGDDSFICGNGSVILGKEILGAKYLWNTGSTEPKITATTAGEYSIFVTQAGCVANDTVNLIDKPAPIINAERSNDIDCSTSYAQLNVSGAVSYVWSPSNGLNDSTIKNPITKIGSTTDYFVRGTDIDGCVGFDTVTVVVKFEGTQGTYSLPNAFTPNGDGRNDCFGLTKWGFLEKLEFAIYNRWGEKMFYTKNSSFCWDGSVKGKKQDPGAFVYLIKAQTLCGEIKRKGIVMLIR